jgi:hypothetical protein
MLFKAIPETMLVDEADYRSFARVAIISDGGAIELFRYVLSSIEVVRM